MSKNYSQNTLKILKYIEKNGSTLAENIFWLFKSSMVPYKVYNRKNTSRQEISNTISRMHSRKWIKLVKNGGQHHYTITGAGVDVITHYKIQKTQIVRPKKWDKKWRIIIFDVSEYKKSARDRIRKNFIKLGLVRLQDSVWIHPYPCEEIIELIKTFYGIRKEVIYLISNRFDHDDKFAKIFEIEPKQVV